MTVLEATEAAIGVQYKLTVDGNSLGLFATCEGLGVEVVMEAREEGGNNEFIHQLPTRLKYTNIKLSRPLGRDTTKVAEWISSMATGYKRRTCQITVLAVDGHEIASWSLLGVVPVRWTGPSLQSEGGKVLTEQVEIAHHGFASPGDAMTSPGLAGASTAASAAGSRQAAVLKLFTPPAAGVSQPGAQYDSIEFEFNPKELTMGKEANWQSHEGQQASAPSAPQYLGPKASRLALELFLDDSAERSGTVVTKVEKLFACCVPKDSNGSNASPPWVQFQWGGITSFVGYVSAVQAKYTLFTPSGLPIRAIVTATLQEFPSAPPRQNPTSGTLVPHREHVIVAGDTLQGIAYAEYGNPNRWRDVAHANRIEDPARLTPGRRLLLPIDGKE